MKQILKRDTALATAAIYDSMFASEDGTVPATFQVIKIEAHFLHKKTRSVHKKCLHDSILKTGLLPKTN